MSSSEAKVAQASPFVNRPAEWQRPASVEEAIIQTVAYVDGYDYPLTAAEIHRYLIAYAADPECVANALAALGRNRERLSQVGGYYVLPGREATVETRRQRTSEAAQLWPEAIRFGRQIATLPFVRMVAVTGSLAVNNIGRHVDIDYFIVTADDFLWLCRAFVIGVVRLAAGRGITLCPNYFLSERALLLTDQNLYTAHEVTQMIPLSGAGPYEAMRAANDWTRDYLPNANGLPDLAAAVCPAPSSTLSKRQARLEAVLRTEAGRRLERRLMRHKVDELRREQQDWAWDESAFTPDCCKGHFHLHKQQALDAYETRLAATVQ
jgi:hypothetical protein